MGYKYYKIDNRNVFFEERFKEQNGKCAICGKKDRLVIDHDHETGLMRGLLCYKHNTGLGLFLDDPTMLRNAAEYLENHKATPFEKKILDSKYEKDLLSKELVPKLLANTAYTSDRARAKALAELVDCNIATAQSRIRRGRKKLVV